MVEQDLIDRAGSIRAGEELDLENLKQYLQPVLGDNAAQMTVKQFPGGHSNLTYLLSGGGEQWVLRRPPFGSKVKSIQARRASECVRGFLESHNRTHSLARRACISNPLRS